MRNEEYYDRELDKLEIYSEEALLQIQDELKKIETEWKEAKRKRQRAGVPQVAVLRDPCVQLDNKLLAQSSR